MFNTGEQTSPNACAKQSRHVPQGRQAPYQRLDSVSESRIQRALQAVPLPVVPQDDTTQQSQAEIPPVYSYMNPQETQSFHEDKIHKTIHNCDEYTEASSPPLYKKNKIVRATLVRAEPVESSPIFNFEEEYDKYPEEDPPLAKAHQKMPQNPYLRKARPNRVTSKKYYNPIPQTITPSYSNSDSISSRKGRSDPSQQYIENLHYQIRDLKESLKNAQSGTLREFYDYNY